MLFRRGLQAAGFAPLLVALRLLLGRRAGGDKSTHHRQKKDGPAEFEDHGQGGPRSILRVGDDCAEFQARDTANAYQLFRSGSRIVATTISASVPATLIAVMIQNSASSGAAKSSNPSNAGAADFATC